MKFDLCVVFLVLFLICGSDLGHFLESIPGPTLVFDPGPFSTFAPVPALDSSPRPAFVSNSITSNFSDFYEAGANTRTANLAPTAFGPRGRRARGMAGLLPLLALLALGQYPRP
ncbi:hypothetical protein EVAR_44194_1 [Eumeta japonica]|uniref:Uncharacterized protein n=1 Tax=Eumeta variegata TaxID=151549 RepID=A0A4C1VZI6_EUMVA|nr:hypothetical protein EVAR_44194_1 [Eumeta japonica]